MRPNAHLYVRPDAYRFVAGGAPRHFGRDVLRYYWPTPVRECSSGARSRFDGRKYSPDQPRVPAGNPTGGQWTSGTGVGQSSIQQRDITFDATGEEAWFSYESINNAAGELSQELVLTRDGSTILSEFNNSNAEENWDSRHTVVTPGDGTYVFENDGNGQTVRDSEGQILNRIVETPNGPQPEAFLQLARSPSPTSKPGLLGAALSLFTWMSSRNAADEVTILDFRASDFVAAKDTDSAAIWVGARSSEEVQNACPRYPEVQSITNLAAKTIDRGAYERPQEFGTAVHQFVREQINGPITVPSSPPRDPNFRAEVSAIKSGEVRYGVLGSVRVDVLENVGVGTVCVYDIKTGKSILTLSRMLEIAGKVSFLYPETKRIIVTEVRPGAW